MSGIMLNVVGGTFGNPVPSGIGAAYGGGYYAGSISTAGTGVADFYLVVGPVASAQSASLRWKTTATSTTGTSSDIDGPTNSANMNNASHPAAQFCEAVTAGSYSDWYMPAKNELEVCYYNLKPTTANNFTGFNSGTNPNSIPPRTGNYTAGTPAQTSAVIFQSPSGAERFGNGQYWSSTESASATAWFKIFNDGYSQVTQKNYSYSVRAIRRVAV
jgi:hypothetical protein